MDRIEIDKELQMTYDELCVYLQGKYGIPRANYYPNEDCKSKSRAISRTSEGLFCHHIFENIYDNLGEPHMAKFHPYECQKKEYLAYCNYIEHLILHLKINVMARASFEKTTDIKKFFNSLGFFWIGADMNYLYKNGGSSQEWRNKCFSVIKDNFEDYVSILKGTIQFIKDNYTGEKRRRIKVGMEFSIEVPDISKKPDMTQVRGNQVQYITVVRKVTKVSRLLKYAKLEGIDKKLNLNKLQAAFDIDCVLKKNIKIMASIEKDVWEELYSRLNATPSDEEKTIAKWLKASGAVSEFRLQEN